MMHTDPRMSQSFITGLIVNGTRHEMINWLCFYDRHGVYTDSDSEMEGIDPLTIEDARGHVLKFAINEGLFIPFE